MITIDPETKVGDLLEAYPEAEAALIAIAPQFKALKNPVLRRTVAKVASLDQAARVAGMSARDLVRALRSALGVEGAGEFADGESGVAAGEGEAPAWVRLDAKATIDAGRLLEAGETPVGTVSTTLAEMEAGEVLTVVAPFQPAPLIDSLKTKGHEVYSRADENGAWRVWIRRK